MDVQVLVAIVGAIATVATAAIASYQVTRRNSTDIIEKLSALKDAWRKEFSELDKRYTVSANKVDILWEIYAEDAIRKAKDYGMVASKSPLSPTNEWENIMPDSLAQKIIQDANETALLLHSPYDITIELWGKYKQELLFAADQNGVSVKVLFGVLNVIARNAISKHIPQS